MHDIAPAIRAAIIELKNDLAAIEEDLELEDADISWEMVMDRLEIIDDPLERLWGVVTLLSSVMNETELRVVKGELYREVQEIQSRRLQSVPIFNAMTSLRQSETWNDFTIEQKRILDRAIIKAKRGGVGLDEKDKANFNLLQQRLDALESLYDDNVLDANKAYSWIIHDKEELLGVPESVLSQLAQNSVRAGIEGASTNNGPWKISLEQTIFQPIMKQCPNRHIREVLFRESVMKASKSPFDNTQIIQEILELRHAKAILLGYDSFGEMTLEDTMAQSLSAIESMLDGLRDKTRAASEIELSCLQEYAASRGQVGPLELWDIPFWSEQYRKEEFELDEEQIRSYFSFPNEANGLEEIWHPDVKFYQIRLMDQPDEPVVAQFYLDPYSRPGLKSHGSSMQVIVSRSKLLRTEKAPVRLPVFTLICNQPVPVGDNPSLMTFANVQSLFHNFGYGIQIALTSAEYTASSGIDGIEWDYGEVVSFLMIKFCYHRATLRSLSSHIETGEQLPDKMFDKISGAKHFMAATALARLLSLAAIDTAIHHSNKPERDSFQLYRSIAQKYCVIPPVQEDRHLCSFAHIFSGGYAACYYSYRWSEFYAADIYAKFEDAQTEDEWIQIGRQFRDCILATLGVTNPVESFESFRGRLPNPRALLKHYGLE